MHVLRFFVTNQPFCAYFLMDNEKYTVFVVSKYKDIQVKWCQPAQQRFMLWLVEADELLVFVTLTRPVTGYQVDMIDFFLQLRGEFTPLSYYDSTIVENYRNCFTLLGGNGYGYRL